MEKKPSKLVIVVPGLRGTAEKWQSLLSRLKQEPHLLEGVEAHWEFWSHEKGPYSFGPARAVGRRLAAFINQVFVAEGPFEEVILVAHSMGGLFIREAYLLAANAYERDRHAATTGWASKVTKFVLFAAISRGFDPESRMSYRMGVAVSKVLGLYTLMTLSDLTRGSAFVTDLRLAWIRYFRCLVTEGKDPVVVQFVGTIDTIVRREDCLDTEQFPKSETIDIPDARHDNLYRLETASDPERRYANIARVFRPGYQPAIPAGAPLVEKPRRIIFVLHGIRAENTGWVEEVCSLITQADPRALPIPAQYGYFSALHFFLPWIRRSRARWFQDRYSELAAKYPDAETKFYFIGHSNGTYMLGRGLQRVSMMRFERAYIAGCVLPPRYPWRTYVESGQIGAIRSDGSSSDWPVGLLCSGLSFMGDIGTGGFSGFESAPPELKEFRYYPGGHSKPLEDRSNLEAIVKYVLTGEEIQPKQLGEPRYFFALASHALRYLGPVILLIILSLLAYAIWTAAFTLWQWLIAVAIVFMIIVFLMSM